MKSWLIAHRGSQCDAKENTLKAFLAVKKYSLGIVEFDLHTTIDNVVVVHHDFTIGDKKIANHTYAELKNLDPELITFSQVIQVINSKLDLIVEIKSRGTGRQILEVLLKHPSWRIASYDYDELIDLANLGIDRSRLLLLQHTHPFGQIKKATRAKFGGVGIKQHYMFPGSYFMARKNHLYIYCYTVNNLLLARLFRLIFPDLGICTNRLDKLQKLN